MSPYLYLLREYQKKQRERQEKERQFLLKEVKEALSELAKVILFKEVYIFGSLLKPYSFFKGSDIDLAFTDLKDEDFFQAKVLLSRRLKREVDVVQLEKQRLKDKILGGGIIWKG